MRPPPLLLRCNRRVMVPEVHFTRDDHSLLDTMGLSPYPVLLDELVGIGVAAQHLDWPRIIGRGGDILVVAGRRVVPVHRSRVSFPQ